MVRSAVARSELMALDVPAQQIINGRQTARKELKHNAHGECIQFGAVINTIARQALDKGWIDTDGYNAIIFYQSLSEDIEGTGAVRMDKIRVDGGKIDMGNKIIDQIDAHRMVEEVKSKIPEAIVFKRTEEFPRAAFCKLLESSGIGMNGITLERLGKSYRPSLNDRRTAEKTGQRFLGMIATAITPMWSKHRMGLS